MRTVKFLVFLIAVASVVVTAACSSPAPAPAPAVPAKPAPAAAPTPPPVKTAATAQEQAYLDWLLGQHADTVKAQVVRFLALVKDVKQTDPALLLIESKLVAAMAADAKGRTPPPALKAFHDRYAEAMANLTRATDRVVELARSPDTTAVADVIAAARKAGEDMDAAVKSVTDWNNALATPAVILPAAKVRAGVSEQIVAQFRKQVESLNTAMTALDGEVRRIESYKGGTGGKSMWTVGGKEMSAQDMIDLFQKQKDQCKQQVQWRVDQIAQFERMPIAWKVSRGADFEKSNEYVVEGTALGLKGTTFVSGKVTFAFDSRGARPASPEAEELATYLTKRYAWTTRPDGIYQLLFQ